MAVSCFCGKMGKSIKKINISQNIDEEFIKLVTY